MINEGREIREIVYYMKEKGYSDTDILDACKDSSLKLDESLVQLNIDNYNVMKEFQRNNPSFFQKLIY